MYLLTLFLKTCFVIPPFDMSSDLVLLSFSSLAPLVMILFRVGTGGEIDGDGDGDGEGDGGGISRDLCFLMGPLSCKCIDTPKLLRPPCCCFKLFFLLLLGLSLSSTASFLHDDEEFEEFCDFSFASSFWLRHQLQIRYDSAFG